MNEKLRKIREELDRWQWDNVTAVLLLIIIFVTIGVPILAHWVGTVIEFWRKVSG